MGSAGGPELRLKRVARAGALTIAANLALTGARVAAGLYSGSTAVLADGANSGMDVLATLVVLSGTRIAALPPDADHPYGHEKAEPVAAKLVGLIITLAGLATAIGAVRALRGGQPEGVGAPAVWVAAISIGVKEVLARHLLRTGRAVNSPALMADGANQRTDVLASSAALVGALGGRFGLTALDPAMGILVAGLILRMGLGLYWRSVTDLMDRAPAPRVMARLRRAAARVAGVAEVDEVKARIFGAGIYVDCKIQVDGAISVSEGHRIASRVKAEVRAEVPEALDVLVHVNPTGEQTHRAEPPG